MSPPTPPSSTGPPAARRYSCADTSQRRREPVIGTASTARGWLLVEEPGPWGAGTVPTTRLGEAATAALRQVAADRSSRLLLVRRPLGRGRDAHRTLFRAACRRGGEQLLTKRVGADADPEQVVAAAADDAGWSEHPGPLLLVCTHGRKDWCCALRGRPVAAALAQTDPEAAWECSHLGGDRFAANLLALPSGITYGRVDAADVAEVSTAARGGRVVTRLLRGRCTDALVVQAADAVARTETGRDDADDLVPRSARRVEGAGEDVWDVRLAAGGARAGGDDVVVRLREAHVPGAARLTCSATAEQHARTWELVDLARAPAA